MSKTVHQITVVIPVYNVEKYLETSVRSVMNQTFRALKIVCVNDGSTDDSRAILERLAEEDDRIVVINQENMGLGGARNTGISVADTEWISFIDSDDTLREDAYEVMSRALASDVDMIHFGTEIVMERGGEPQKNDKRYYEVRYEGLTEITDTHIMNSDVSSCNKLFRKSILDKYDIRFDHIRYEDFAFTVKYLSVSKTVWYVKDKLYNYLRRANSIMNDTFKGTPYSIDHLYSYNYVYEFMVKNNILDEHKDCMTNFFISCYWFSVNHGTEEIIPEVEEYATYLWSKSPLLRDGITKTLVFAPKYVMKQRTITRILEKAFSIKNEMEGGNLNKVVRLFGVAIYKKSKK